MRDVRLVCSRAGSHRGNARRSLADITAIFACGGAGAEGTHVDTHAALGHRRLAMIDLPAGRPPMTIAGERRPDAAVLIHSRDLQLP